jgi:hypothetical protein
MSPTQTQPTTTLNGLDTQKMAETVSALKVDPTLARFEFRARNRWMSGGENRSTIKDFYGAGAEDVSRHEAFEFTNGEPPVLLGHNEGANPVEFLLHALGGCVTTTTVLHAAARGIEIESLSTTLVGDIDLQDCWRSATFRPDTGASASRWTSRRRTRATRIWTICSSLRRRTRRCATRCVDLCRSSSSGSSDETEDRGATNGTRWSRRSSRGGSIRALCATGCRLRS